MSTGREFPESGQDKALSRPGGKFKSGISGISGQNQSSNYGKIVHTFGRNFQRFLVHLKQHMRAGNYLTIRRARLNDGTVDSLCFFAKFFGQWQGKKKL